MRDPFTSLPDTDPAHTASMSVFEGVDPKNPPNLPGALPSLPDINSKEFWSDAQEVKDIHAPDFWKDAMVLDAPPNTVFDEKNNRTLALPQTLNADETDYIIKRDVDEVKDFFAMQETGGFTALGKGVGAFLASQPQALGALLKEQGELAKSHAGKPIDMAALIQNPLKGYSYLRDAIINNLGSDDLIAAADKLIERNKKYMAQAGLERPEEGGLSGYLYDAGQGISSSLAALGLAGLTRSPSTAGLYFGALQKSSVYQEARSAGKTADEASSISSLAGIAEGALEYVGLDYFLHAIKANTMVKKFLKGAAVEFIQESSQQTAEEAITQGAAVRDKSFQDTVEDILYNGFLGALIGGGTSVAVGAFVRDEAQKKGINPKTSAALGTYAQKNVEQAKKNMGEFVEKELAPIAKDDATAQKFMTLMQDFGNDKNLVNRDTLDPATREAFDQWVEIFNQSVVAKEGGTVEVEQAFLETAKAGGVAEDVATANAAVWGKVAEKLSRVWGITPKQWYDLHGPESITAAQAQNVQTAPQVESGRSAKDMRRMFSLGGEMVDEEYRRKRSEEDLGTAMGDDEILFQKEGRGNQKNLLIRPLSLRGFVRKNGGIKDSGGELHASDLHKDKRFKGVLNNKNGKSADALLRLAQNAGYFADESDSHMVRTLTTNDFLQALINEARGIDTYSARDQTKAERYGEYVNYIHQSDFEDYAVEGIIEAAKNDGLNLTKDEAREVAILRDQGYDEQDAIDKVIERGAIQTENTLSEIAGENSEYEIPDVPEIKDARKTGGSLGETQAPRSRQERRSETGGQSSRTGQGQKIEPSRAAVTFREGQRPIINLFEAADESSLLHESAHIWLREFQAAAAITKDPRVRRDWGLLQKWLKAQGGKMTVAQEEKFARGVEQYFRNGKAPVPEMQPVFDRFKEWLRRIYTSAKDLKVTLTPEVQGVFDKLFGGEFTQRDSLPDSGKSIRESARESASSPAGEKPSGAGTQQSATPEAGEEHDIESDLAAHREMAADQEKWSVPGSLMDWGSDVFTPASSRLGRIAIKLKHIVRRFVFDVGLGSHEDREIVRPFVEKAADTMSAEDYKDLDFALKNRLSKVTEALVRKYDMEKDYGAVRELLDRIHIEAQNTGMDIGFIEDYFPRRVRRGMEGEYLAAIRNEPFWGELKLAMHEADPDGAFTLEDQAEFVDKWLRSQVPANKITLARKSFAKDRPIDYIKPEWNRFYQDSMETLISYIGAMRHGIESRKLFGKSEKDKDASIGHYVLNLVQQGAITHEQEAEVKKILKAVVEPALGMHSWVSWARNVTYMYTMGSPISTLTQLQDFAYSLYEHKWRAFPALGRSLAGRTILSKEDLGLEDLLAEYQTQEGASKAVKTMFKLIGLTWTDATFADAYIDATYRKLQAQAKNSRGDLNDLLEEVYGDQAEKVRQDILAGRMTEDVKYLMFSELSDVRPLSLAEQPLSYLNSKNGRIFYMLKTYAIKQIDFFRREAFDDIFSGDAGRTVAGMRRLTGLAMSLAVMGMGSDALKDLLLGRDFDLTGLVIDNMLKLFGFSKYTIYKAKKDSLEEAFWGLITPPIATLPSDVFNDVTNIAQGDRDLAESKVLGHTPLVGKFWYWWYGGGADKK